MSRVAPGDLVAGKYRVERVHATGGMGVVVVARHLELQQDVAIKIMSKRADDELVAARFLREARAAAKIQSDHVARVFDCGRLDDGTPYMVMEYLDGEDLRQSLATRGAFPITEAVDVLIEAIQGVADAHVLGIVHRDLKPANLFRVTRHGRKLIKVLDFGISKVTPAVGDEEPELTHTSAVLGSPRYMSPEQATSAKHVDARSDVWSLGIIAYELLDGQVPFSGTSLGDVIGKILRSDPVPLTALRPDVPEELWQIVRRCLERDPARRFANVAELARALAPFASERGKIMASEVPDPTVRHDSPPLETPPLPPDPPTRSSWASASARRSPRGKTLLVAAGAVAAASIASVIWLGSRASDPEPRVEPSGAAAAIAPSSEAPPVAPATSTSFVDVPDAAPAPLPKERAPARVPKTKTKKRDILGTSD